MQYPISMLNHYQGNIHETICNEKIMLKSNYYCPAKAFRLASHHENPENYTREEDRQIPLHQREPDSIENYNAALADF